MFDRKEKMQFSIFENDGSLGALENARVVVLRGTTRVSQLFSPNLFPIDSYLQTALSNAGFAVLGVRSTAAGWVGYDINIEIEVEVYNNFSAEEVRRNASAAIQAYRANFGVNQVFSNTALNVIADGRSPVGAGVPSAYDLTNPANQKNGFIDNLAFGLGLSAPVVVAGGVVLAILVLKR